MERHEHYAEGQRLLLAVEQISDDLLSLECSGGYHTERHGLLTARLNRTVARANLHFQAAGYR